MKTSMSQTDELCAACEQPLMRQPMGNYHRLVCNNWQCRLYKEGQGNIPRDGHITLEPLKGLAAARRYLAGNPARKEVRT